MLFREEKAYLEIARRIIDEGYRDKSRTGIDIRKTHVEHMSFDLTNGKVPLLSTRYINPEKPIVEMLWFISGSTDIKFLKDNKFGIWDSWVIPETAVYDSEIDLGLREAIKSGKIVGSEALSTERGRKELIMKYGDGTVNQLLGEILGMSLPTRKLVSGSIGPGAYGAQWRKWEDIRQLNAFDSENVNLLEKLGYTADYAYGPNDETATSVYMRKEHDQLQEAINLINNNPDSRRIVVSAWNPGRLDQAVLPPCHSFFQFLPFEKDGVKYLDLALTCRSQDFLVGTVFNVFQYSVLCHMVAHITGRQANRLFWTGNNSHVYENQVEVFNDEHRDRFPEKNEIELRFLGKHDFKTIDDFKPGHFAVSGYTNHQEIIKYPVAV